VNEQRGTSGRAPDRDEPRLGASRDGPREPEPRIDHEGATSLLRMAMVGPRRGVDGVIDRLRMPDGAEWLESALMTFPAPSAAEARTMLVEGSAGLERLAEAKERHKQAMLSGAPASQRQRAILLYYLCVAAGLAHHGLLLTSQPQGEVSAALLDLAVALPEPWSLMLARAAEPG
jgi:hypothetical protein